MNLIGVANTVQRTMLASPLFPYKTGQLHDNFIDKGSEANPNKNNVLIGIIFTKSKIIIFNPSKIPP